MDPQIAAFALLLMGGPKALTPAALRESSRGDGPGPDRKHRHGGRARRGR